MILVFFLLFSTLTIYLSIKLSYYADIINKTTKISGAFIGGILLAGITSLPELVTCFSSLYLNNPYLAIGDILGSNLFNITIMCLFDIIFIKKLIFNNVKSKHYLIYILLLINYIFIYLSLNSYININIFNIGLPTFIIIITYIYYLVKITKEQKQEEKTTIKKDKYIIIKFILTAIIMIIISILLTNTVNKITILIPSFSSSFIGAILLGIVTSLPEVITFITLIKLNNSNMALSNIIGSNLFNLLVLAIGDIALKNNSIYFYADKSNLFILNLCLLTTIVNLIQVIKYKKNIIIYIIPSLIIICLYIYFWIIHLIL